MRFNLVQEGDAVVRAFGVAHAFAIAGEGDDVGHAVGRGLVQRRVHQRLQALVILLAVQRFRNRAPGPRRIHAGNQAVLFERGPVGGSDQVESFDAQVGGFAATVVETRAAGEDSTGHALFDSSLALDCCLGERGRGRKSR